MNYPDNHEWAVISVRPSHGTARRVSSPTVLPAEKSAKECFWARVWADRVDWKDNVIASVRPCHDSNGNHDVVIEFNSGSVLGVQVTELTSELERKRAAMRRRVTGQVIEALVAKRVLSTKKMAVLLHVTSDSSSDCIPKLNPDRVVCVIEEAIRQNQFDRQTLDGHHITFLLVDDGDSLYGPRHGNISIDIVWDQVPRTLRAYQEAVDVIVKKKANSCSPVLLIWSLNFWRDKHAWGASLLDYMSNALVGLPACLIVFMESLDGETGSGEGLFWSNLCITIVKPPSGRQGGELDALAGAIIYLER